MEKIEKKSFLSRLLNFKSKNKTDGKRLYSNTQQTTNKIKLALLDLLSNNELSKVNITQLVKVAGVYRATFYLHYKSLNDVLLDIERDVCECYNAIKDQMEEVDLYNNIEILIDKITEYLNIDKKYLAIIINTKCFSRITLKLREMLREIITDNFTKFGHIKNDQDLLNVSSFTGAIVFVYRDWIDGLQLDVNNIKKYIIELKKQII